MPIIRGGLRTLLLAFACSAVIACQTVSSRTGSGSLTISYGVAQNFEKQYLELPTAGFYFVSEDGQYSSYNHCLEGSGKCDFGNHEVDALRSCERASRQKCYLFARGHEVIWEGDIYIPGGRKLSPTRLDLGQIATTTICNHATTRRTGEWELREKYAPYVKEAKRRGLSVQQCLQSSVNQAVENNSSDETVPKIPIGEFSFAPNFQLCAHALDPTRAGAKWRKLYEYEPYVRELKKRGITAQTCQEIGADKRRVVTERRPELGSDATVCGFAMDANWTPPWWGITYRSIPYAQAARARGLTIVACQVLLGGASTARRYLSQLSDSEVCAQAVTANQANAIWSSGKRYRYHIAEAERRGYTPKTCMGAIFGPSS